MDKGTEDQLAVHRNREQFERIRLRQRVLRDVSKRDPATTLFGTAMAMPVAIGPTGIAGMLAYRGELALAKAAARVGVPFTLATGSLTSMEIIAELEATNTPERAGRAMDHESEDAFERLRTAGYL